MRRRLSFLSSSQGAASRSGKLGAELLSSLDDGIADVPVSRAAAAARDAVPPVEQQQQLFNVRLQQRATNVAR